MSTGLDSPTSKPPNMAIPQFNMEDLLSGFKSLLATQLTQVTETIQTKLDETDRRVEHAKLDLGNFKKEFELTRNEVKGLKEVMLEIRGYLGGIDTMRRLPEEPIREEKVEEKKDKGKEREKEIEQIPSEEKADITNDDELKGATTQEEQSSSLLTLSVPKQENSSFSLNGVPSCTVSTPMSDSQTPTESEDSTPITATSPPSSVSSSSTSSDSSTTSASEPPSTTNPSASPSSEATTEASPEQLPIASTSSQAESPDQGTPSTNPSPPKSKFIIGQSKFNPRTHLNFKVALDPNIDEKVMDCIKEVLVDRKEPFYLWPFVDGEVPGGCFEEFASPNWSNINFSELPNSEEKMKSSTWPVYLKREENSIFLTFVEKFQWEHDRWDIKRYYIGKMDPKSNFESIRVIAFNMKDPEQSLRVTLSLEE